MSAPTGQVRRTAVGPVTRTFAADDRPDTNGRSAGRPDSVHPE